MFDATTHDFGYITYKKPAITSFTISNIGNDTLRIEDIAASCACTTSDVVSFPLLIEPNGATKLDITYDASQLGAFHKIVAIRSNATTPVQYLTLTGRVLKEGIYSDTEVQEGVRIGDFILNTRNINFGIVNSGQRVAIELQILNIGQTALSPQFLHLPPYLTAQVLPETLPPLAKGTIELTLSPAMLDNIGLHQSSFYLARYEGDNVAIDNALNIELVLIPAASTNNKRDIALMPSMETIYFKLPKRGTISKTITLQNLGSAELVMQRLQVSNPAVNLRVSRSDIKPGGKARLTATINTRLWEQSNKEARIYIISNDTNNPLIQIDIDAQ